jgi:hypothetical protein
MGVNVPLYNLKYVNFESNVSGAPNAGGIQNLPWATLNSTLNTNGTDATSGYLIDEPAGGFTGFTFNVDTYPGLRQLHDHAFDELKAEIYKAYPQYAAEDILKDGPQGLDQIMPGLYELWSLFGDVPDIFHIPLVPFQFNIVAAATSMTRAEFVAQQIQQADQLRTAILADSGIAFRITDTSISTLSGEGVPDTVLAELAPLNGKGFASKDDFLTAVAGQLNASDLALYEADLLAAAANHVSPALTTLAADQSTWEEMYVASLEQTGLLLPDGSAPPLTTDPKIISVVATLSAGILAGPAGQKVLTNGSLSDFFNQVRRWYGNNPSLTAPIDPSAPGFTSNSLGFLGLLQNPNPIPKLPTFAQYNLGLSLPTTFEAFNVYVPWVGWGLRANGIPADYAINGITPDNTQHFFPLNLDQYYANAGFGAGAASMTGPFTVDTNGFVPVGQPLPFTVNFQNDPSATTDSHEVRVTVPLDPSLDAETFQLGDIKIGNITVHIPSGRSLFQGDFDFTQSNGFILRVSAGVDLKSHAATWLLQAIDPLTGQVMRDPTKGLLVPNDARGDGAGYVSYTIEADPNAATGTALTASANVTLDNVPPEDTAPLTWTIDNTAPTTTLTVTQSPGTGNYDLKWSSTDDVGGSGVKSVTLYVAVDGGNYTIWQRDLTDATGELVYNGQVGHTYQFLALAADNAGNREQPPAGQGVPDDGSGSNLGSTPALSTTPPNFGQPPPPATTPSTNPLFTRAQQGVPSPVPTTNASEFTRVLAPFQAQAFVTGVGQSEGAIGPMALAEEADGSFLVSGGASRNQLFHVSKTGSAVSTLLATEPFPIYNLAFDAQGRLWATTGGGPLLQLDPATGDVLGQFGDAIELGLALDPTTGLLYVGTGTGVDTFDPTTDTFASYSRDLNLRVASLAFASDGSLWATTWPDRTRVVRFSAHPRAEVQLTFEAPIDSIAFGQAGTALDGLLFVSHNSGPNGSDLTMVDTATLQQVAVASGGSRGNVVLATHDGRLLISQSSQVDVLNPITNPSSWPRTRRTRLWSRCRYRSSASRSTRSWPRATRPTPRRSSTRQTTRWSGPTAGRPPSTTSPTTPRRTRPFSRLKGSLRNSTPSRSCLRSKASMATHWQRRTRLRSPRSTTFPTTLR